ncbi:PAP2 (acid phosphatase) superfamily protein [Delftia tsuruhatensis]|uniref:phosphatase PAP2 family protein n=1 Tax=Delftia tsuruhatensis TaxID=180282 RepID=UPI001E6AE780|nr:phosphatase PAP2 family protein [Delftia tsuruhatensis]CAB5677650.1 PAP2 (acid phosphatase) superfamily protein [Delftia tsuruhatensis]CAC9693000.1 PAP2 (acid phosphatase) superfamily protein [Delftia tsuruhatensis]
MLWDWIDAHAALGGLCLVLAALCGLFFHLRRQGAATGLRMPVAAWRALGMAGAMAALALAVMARDMLGLADPAGCASCNDWPAMDEALHQWLAGHATDAWVRPVAAFTQLGHVGWMIALSLLVMLVLLWRRDWLHAGAWLVATAGVGLWIRAIKTSVGRPRPQGGWVPEGGFSFPSGHSAGTFVLYLMLAWLLLPYLRPAWRWPAGLAALTVALGVGGSRVVLRVHFASDVLAGWLLGLAWMALVVCAVEWAQTRAAGRRC